MNEEFINLVKEYKVSNVILFKHNIVNKRLEKLRHQGMGGFELWIILITSAEHPVLVFPQLLLCIIIASTLIITTENFFFQFFCSSLPGGNKIMKLITDYSR